jgi:hypothetical protein
LEREVSNSDFNVKEGYPTLLEENAFGGNNFGEGDSSILLEREVGNSGFDVKEGYPTLLEENAFGGNNFGEDDSSILLEREVGNSSIAKKISVNTIEQPSVGLIPASTILANYDALTPTAHFILQKISFPRTTVNDEMFDFLVYLKNYSPTLVDLWYFSIDSNKITNFKERPEDRFEPYARWKYAVSKIVETHNALRIQQQTGQIYDLCDARLLHKNVLSLKLMNEGFFYPAFIEILSKEESEPVVMKTNQLRFIHRCLKVKDDYHLHLFLNIFFLLKKWIMILVCL